MQFFNSSQLGAPGGRKYQGGVGDVVVLLLYMGNLLHLLIDLILTRFQIYWILLVRKVCTKR
ncbi:hypothetical protein HMPREF0240_00353 [Clostridium sp. D5]|nr:hypothetical protein HMPREF0240_00353 [Clostridium sp. D5]